MRYIEFVDRFVTEEQKYDRRFGLIDCEIGTTSEQEDKIVSIKPVWLFVVRSFTTKALNWYGSKKDLIINNWRRKNATKIDEWK